MPTVDKSQGSCKLRVHFIAFPVIAALGILFSALYLDAYKPWSTKDPYDKHFDFAKFDLSGRDNYQDITTVLKQALPIGVSRKEAEKVLLENAGLSLGSVFRTEQILHQRYNYKYPALLNTGLKEFWVSADYDQQNNLSQLYIKATPVYESQPKLDSQTGKFQ